MAPYWAILYLYLYFNYYKLQILCCWGTKQKTLLPDVITIQ